MSKDELLKNLKDPDIRREIASIFTEVADEEISLIGKILSDVPRKRKEQAEKRERFTAHQAESSKTV